MKIASGLFLILGTIGATNMPPACGGAGISQFPNVSYTGIVDEKDPNTGSELEDLLAGHVFEIEGQPEYEDSLAASCNTGEESIFTNISSEGNNTDITFNEDGTASLGKLPATWEVIDEDTIEVTIYDDTEVWDVEVDEDVLIISLPEDFDCDE